MDDDSAQYAKIHYDSVSLDETDITHISDEVLAKFVKKTWTVTLGPSLVDQGPKTIDEQIDTMDLYKALAGDTGDN